MPARPPPLHAGDRPRRGPRRDPQGAHRSGCRQLSRKRRHNAVFIKSAYGEDLREQVTGMTVLVTGGAGYIGSHMVRELVDAGEHVAVLDNLSTGFAWLVPQGVPLVVGDTGDQELVARLIRQHRVEAIIHFAASIVVPDSVR